MFVPRQCAESRCGRPALSGADRCAVHHPDAAAHVRGLLVPVDGRIILADLDLAGIGLADLDLSGCQLTGCRLTASTLQRVKLSGASIQLCFLDRATILDCDFSGATILNTVFAGSKMEGCKLSDCEVIQVNFLGIRGVRTLFDHSNLYGSRFVGSWLENVSMRDCNLKRASFDLAHRQVVDFRSSNVDEASFLELAP